MTTTTGIANYEPDAPPPTGMVVPSRGKPAEPMPERLGLKFTELRHLIAEVDAAIEPTYLVEGVIPDGDYGMLGGAPKAGKSWALLDLAVSVASRTPWLGVFPVPVPGPVIYFAGEGGRRKLVRRIRAISEQRGIDPATLVISVCERAPRLTDDVDLEEVEREIAQMEPALVIVDPFYLAAAGAKSSDLFAMAVPLSKVQSLCQGYGAALLFGHHFRKGEGGRGSEKLTGAGPAAWGRVLLSLEVTSEVRDPATGASTALVDLTIQGDETATMTVGFRRRVWADDPARLSSPMHYEVERIDAGARGDGLGANERRVLDVIEADPDQHWTRKAVESAAGLGTRAAQRALQALVAVERLEGGNGGRNGAVAVYALPGLEIELTATDRAKRVGDAVDTPHLGNRDRCAVPIGVAVNLSRSATGSWTSSERGSRTPSCRGRRAGHPCLSRETIRA
jgi:hypothetical protein